MHRDFQKIKGVFFDAEGTLLRVKGGVGKIYSIMAERFGVSVDPVWTHQRFVSAWKQMPALTFPGVDPKEVLPLEKKWWREVVEKVFEEVAISDFDGFYDAVYAAFEGEEGWELFAESREVLGFLKGKGYRLGIVSNFDSRIFCVLEKLGIRSFFNDIIISTHIGAAKPHAQIFYEAMSRLSLTPDASAYVGDSPFYDLEGAQAVGMLSILVDREGRHKDVNGIRIGSLEPLIKMFG